LIYLILQFYYPITYKTCMYKKWTNTQN
jgi:hypothetical protein